MKSQVLAILILKLYTGYTHHNHLRLKKYKNMYIDNNKNEEDETK